MIVFSFGEGGDCRMLTDYQREVMVKMDREGAVVRTSDRADYRVSLHYPSGKSETLRKDTANALFLKGYLGFARRIAETYTELVATGKVY